MEIVAFELQIADLCAAGSRMRCFSGSIFAARSFIPVGPRLLVLDMVISMLFAPSRFMVMVLWRSGQTLSITASSAVSFTSRCLQPSARGLAPSLAAGERGGLHSAIVPRVIPN